MPLRPFDSNLMEIVKHNQSVNPLRDVAEKASSGFGTGFDAGFKKTFIDKLGVKDESRRKSMEYWLDLSDKIGPVAALDEVRKDDPGFNPGEIASKYLSDSQTKKAEDDSLEAESKRASRDALTKKRNAAGVAVEPTFTGSDDDLDGDGKIKDDLIRDKSNNIIKPLVQATGIKRVMKRYANMDAKTQEYSGTISTNQDLQFFIDNIEKIREVGVDVDAILSYYEEQRVL